MALQKDKMLERFVNEVIFYEKEVTIDPKAAKILNQTSEKFVWELISRSILLKNNRRSASRNKSIRPEDVKTALFDLPQFSFLSNY